VRILKTSLLVAAVVTVSACGSSARPGVETVCAPDIEEAPCTDGVKKDAAYSFHLMTHCGIEWAYLDGRYWVPRVRVKTPPEWAAITDGTMTLLSEQRAVFERATHSIVFVPAPESYRPPTCA
jgi:hypothetical protein